MLINSLNKPNMSELWFTCILSPRWSDTRKESEGQW